MPLRLRIAAGFALVALATAAMIALATPGIVNQGFTELQSELDATAPAGLGQPTQVTTAAVPTNGETESEDGAAATGAEASGENEAAEDSQAAALRETEARESVAQGTVGRLVLVALFAALVASMFGLIVAGRLVRPLSRLEHAAQDVAHGVLSRRSGLAERGDELGQLGRSFDSMAERLEAEDDNRRRFLQDAVHELRTPITVIDATATAILDGVYPPDPAHLETIRAQSQLLSRIVDDLRTISLAEGGSLPLRQEPVSVRDVLAAVARGFDARAAERGVRLEVSVTGEPAVSADPDRVRQMTGALVDNAIRHSPAGGTVRLSGTPESSRAVRIAIEDDGPGIPASELPHVFDRFYQGNPAPGRPKGTSGLGLSIVSALAEAQGGTAGAENKPEGGARVWFELRPA